MKVNFLIVPLLLSILISCKKDEIVTEEKPNYSIIELSHTLSSGSSETGYNDTVAFTMSCLNENKVTLEILWYDKESGALLKTSNYDTHKITDSLNFAWKSFGIKTIINKVKFKDEEIYSKEVSVNVIDDKMVVKAGEPIEVPSVGSIVNVRADVHKKYGKIIDIAWDFDGRGNKYDYISVASIDTNFVFENNTYIYLRATDDDGNVEYDSLKVSMPAWKVRNSTSSYPWTCTDNKLVRHQNKVYIPFCNGMASYDFTLDSWTPLSSMPDLHRGHSGKEGYSFNIYNDQIIIIGGADQNTFFNLKDFMIYDINSSTYTSSTIPIEFSDCTSEIIGDKLYIFSNDKAVHIYDFTSNEWTMGAPMPDIRRNSTSAAFGSKVYLYGGRDAANNSTNTLLVYDTGTNNWTAAPTAPQSGSFCSATSYMGKMYIFGGDEPQNKNLEFDISKNTWRKLPESALLPEQSVSNKCIGLEDRIIIFSSSGKIVEYYPENETW